VLALKGIRSQSAREKIEGIPVGRHADTLCFLQNCALGPELIAAIAAKQDAGIRLFSYIVRYADGSAVEIPVIWNQQIGEWIRKDSEWRDLPQARLAWTLPVRTLRGPLFGNLFVYAFEWTNPHPDRVIATLDIVTANTADTDYGAPAIFAISTGKTP
jgi:hypothetical protein